LWPCGDDACDHWEGGMMINLVVVVPSSVMVCV
jgi:hypothetical protein